MDHVTHLGGISPPDWHTKPCERLGKTEGAEYVDLDFRGLNVVPPDCAAWLLDKEADRPLNVFEASNGLLPMLTCQDPPFEEDLGWLQFAYTADLTGAYVVPVYKVLAQSVVAEGGEPFPEILAHLKRLYPEVYGTEVSTGWAPERREFQIGEREGLSNETIINSIKVGAYAGRLNHINLVGMNKLIPNLTTVYLDTPLVGPTPDPLEYVPSPGRIGHPSGYPSIITGCGPYTGGSKLRPPPPLSLYITHPRMNPTTS